MRRSPRKMNFYHNRHRSDGKLISKKRDDSIAELNAIKHCGFIEVEFIKFYNNIKNLILNEAEKFLSVFNNMFIIYNKFRDKDNNEIINLIKIK